MLRAASTISVALALSTSVSAIPVTQTRRSTACGFNSVFGVPSFTLLATNKNDTSVRRPLVLSVVPGVAPGVSVLVTQDTVADPIGSNFTMVSGLITSFPFGSSPDQQTSNLVPDANTFLTFSSPGTVPAEASGASYCEYFNTSPHGTTFPYGLGVNGTPDEYSLCSSLEVPDVDVVVFNAIEGATMTPFSYDTCVPVDVNVITPGLTF
ncbi:hypothetical protein OF83DRAFT_1103555 [Amylostereum chailletii]|nr:hypothetical protein OF83DRAFT_1103555 [Amylostereum chailletii]